MSWQNQRLFVSEESSFGTSEGEFRELYVEELTASLEQESIERPVHRPTLDRLPNVAGIKSPTVGFSVEAIGLLDPLMGQEASFLEPLANLLGAAGLMSNKSRISKGGTAGPDGTATTLDIPDQETSAPVGSMVLVEQGGEYFVRVVTSHDANAAHIWPPLLEKQNPGEKVYGGVSFFPSPSGEEDTVSLVRQIMSADGTIEHTITGAAGNVSLSVEAGQRAMMAFELAANSFERTTQGGLPDPEKPTKKPVLGKCAFLHWENREIVAASIEFTPGVEHAAFESPMGCEGRTGWNFSARNPVLTFTPLFSGDFEDDFTAGTERKLLLQIGTEAGRCIAIYIPSAQIIAAPSPEEVNGVAGQSIQVRANESNDPTVPSFLWGFF